MWTGSPTRGSFLPKNPIYLPNGTGRDTYIVQDSGGFIKGGIMPIGGLSPKPIGVRQPPLASINGKSIHYHSDGTGRDIYISNDAGGLMPGSTKDNFYQTLRSYNKSKSPQRNGKDFFLWAQKTKQSHERAEIAQKSMQIRKMLDRLTMQRSVVNWDSEVVLVESPTVRSKKGKTPRSKSLMRGAAV